MFFLDNLYRYGVRAWLAYTPEFQPLVVAWSSPVPLTLSLWLITAAHTRALALQANMRLAMTSPLIVRPEVHCLRMGACVNAATLVH